MSAVKKLRYEYLEAPAPAVQPKVNKRPKTVKQPWYARLSVALLMMTIVLVFAGFSSMILYRLAYIHQMQMEIFDIKQTIKHQEKVIDELVVKKESFMTIKEIEHYATEQLDMVKPNEHNKIIISAENYAVLDKSIAFKPLPQYHAKQYENNGLVVQLVSAINSAFSK